MQRWFTIQTNITGHNLLYTHELVCSSGFYADQIPEFIDQLVEHIYGYATCDNVDLARQFNAYYHIPGAAPDELTRQALRELLTPDADGYYRKLMGFVGECLAHWFYKSFEPDTIAIMEPKFGSQDPAWDLLAVTGERSSLHTILIQAKSTTGYAGSLCNDAVEQFIQLHAGKYLFELTDGLRLLAREPAVQKQLSGRPWRDVLLHPDLREYAIYVAYGGSSPEGSHSRWPDLWATRIPGRRERRKVIKLQLADSRSFIATLVEKLYARIP